MLDPQVLVRDALPESAAVEFKRDLPGNGDRDRYEFLKDVCAFANSGGGLIYYGVVEEQGAAAALVPISGQSFDDVVRRLGQILDAGIEPRLPGVEFKRFDDDNGFILGIRVPPSFNAPHRFSHNGHSKFVLRNNTHNTEMTFDQLRQAFNRTGSLIEEAKRDWERDWTKVAQRKTWKPLPDGPMALIQFVPLASLENPALIDVQKVYEDYASFMFSSWGGASNTFNLDGVLFYQSRDETFPFLTQVHRTGKVEALRTAGTIFDEEKIIPSQSIAEFFREAITKFSAFAAKYEIPAPYVINSALLEVQDYRLGLQNRFYFVETLLADRKHLVLPSLYFESSFSEAK